MLTIEDVVEGVEVAIGFVIETNYPVALRPLEVGLSDADHFTADEQPALRAVLHERFVIADATTKPQVEEPVLMGVDPETGCLLLAQLDKQGNLEYLIAPEGYEL